MLEPWWPVIQWAAVGAVAAFAAVWDVRTGRVPNALTFGAAGAGLLFSTLHSGGWGFLASLFGCAAGIALFLPIFAAGGMGGGDVKLLGAIGAWLGPLGAVRTALWASIAGGVLAVVVSLWTGYLFEALRNLIAMFGVWRTVGLSPVLEVTLSESRGPKLAYAVPIGIGAAVALWLARP